MSDPIRELLSQGPPRPPGYTPPPAPASVGVLLGSHVNGYNTQLSPEQESQYQKYKASLGDQGTDHNYDLRGYWMKQGRFDPAHEAGAHFTDEFKKPNHPTFSIESIYAGSPDGQGGTNVAGRWMNNGKTYQAPPSVYANPDRLNNLKTYLGSPFGEAGRVQLAPPQQPAFF